MCCNIKKSFSFLGLPTFNLNRLPFIERLSIIAIELSASALSGIIPACAGSDRQRSHPERDAGISIRAPHTGSDHRVDGVVILVGISIRAPHTGSNLVLDTRAHWLVLFQSALPIRGATRGACPASRLLRHFNPRSPYGERHSLLALPQQSDEFQSALPIRGATCVLRLLYQRGRISIRAPHTGSDRSWLVSAKKLSRFQSALPIRGATATFCSVTLLSAKYCVFKDRRRKFSR